MRIYIESTIPSYVVARPVRDLLQAARHDHRKVVFGGSHVPLSRTDPFLSETAYSLREQPPQQK